MTIVRVAASVLMLGSLALLPACGGHTYAEEHPDPSAYIKGDTGLQSKDVIVMSQTLAPKVIQIPEIAGNPNRVLVVLMDMDNQTRTMAGQNLNVFTMNMQGVLAQYATTHIRFIERRALTQRMQQAEGGGAPDLFEEGSRNGVPAPTQKTAQYALYGTVVDMPNNSSTYYYCNMKLTDMATGEIVWLGSYDTKTRTWKN